MTPSRDPLRRRIAWILSLAATTAFRPLAAQGERFFPAVPDFEFPLASPRVNGLVGRVVQVDRPDNAFGDETEGDVSIGEGFSLVALRRGARPLTLGFAVAVTGRFSLDDSKSALISNDWRVGFDLSHRRAAWDLTLHYFHESSHLGDEYLERFPGSARADWTGESVALWVARTWGRVRVTAGGSYMLTQSLPIARGGGAVGVDYRGPAGRTAGVPVAILAGVYADAYDATAWRISWSAVAGVRLAGDHPTRGFFVGLTAHQGLSTQRQFFRSVSRYYGLEIRFDL